MTQERSPRPRIVAFLPVRGGSRSIPEKNIRLLAGRPLVYWTARACSRAGAIDEIFVATDSARIREVVEGLGLPRVTVIGRSAETATDEATTESALLEFAGNNSFEIVALVQATSPLLTADDLRGAIRRFLSANVDSMLSVARTHRFRWERRGNLVEPVNYRPERRPRRQDWNGELIETGAFYLTRRETLLRTGCRVSGATIGYEVAPSSAHELDEPEDWMVVESLLRSQVDVEGTHPSAARVRLLCVDVDGTLTDGGMYYSAEGEALKRFHTQDAMGLRRLREAGVEIAVITTEDSPIVVSRAKKLRLQHVHIGVQDKTAHVSELIAAMGISWEETGFIGDDLNDLDVIEKAGFSACPGDAQEAVRSRAQFVCTSGGGRGAVREVCDLILRARGAGEHG